MKIQETDALIASLSGQLEPVRPLRFSYGMALSLAGLGASLALVLGLFGMRADVMAGHFDPLFVLGSGLFLLLGLAAAVTVVTMGRPRVGSDHGGWIWAASMATLLPLTALVSLASNGGTLLSASVADEGLQCLVAGSLFSLVTFALLVGWLRRGAPTSTERAGLLAGIAAGSFGIFAFSLHCSSSDIVHIGVFHGMVVALSAVVGRFAVPPLIRW